MPLFIPRGVHVIVASDLLIHLFGLLWVYFLYEFGRYTRINTPRLNLCVAQYNRSCGYNRPFADHCVIEYYGPHTHKGPFADLGSVDSDIVSYRDIILYLYG